MDLYHGKSGNIQPWLKSCLQMLIPWFSSTSTYQSDWREQISARAKTLHSCLLEIHGLVLRWKFENPKLLTIPLPFLLKWCNGDPALCTEPQLFHRIFLALSFKDLTKWCIYLLLTNSEATWSFPGLPWESLSSVCHWNSTYGTGIGAAGLAWPALHKAMQEDRGGYTVSHRIALKTRDCQSVIKDVIGSWNFCTCGIISQMA